MFLKKIFSDKHQQTANTRLMLKSKSMAQFEPHPKGLKLKTLTDLIDIIWWVKKNSKMWMAQSFVRDIMT